MNVRESIIILYTEMYKQCTLRQNFTYKKNYNNEITIDKFIFWIENKYGESVTINLLTQYFEFQFSRFEGIVCKKFGKNSIMLNWIIGKKAIDEWNKRENSKQWIVKVKLNKEVKLNLKKAFKSQIEEKRKKEVNKIFCLISPTEETEKKRFFNQEQGFVYCDINTTLFNPNSIWCSKCKFANDCKRNLSNLYPSLYKHRLADVG